jgi:ABC-type antimicrobial peptide transport system permease subunit
MNLKKISCLLILLTIVTGICALLLLFSINEAGKKEVLKGIKKAGNSHLLFLAPTIFTQDRNEYGILSYHDITLLKNSLPQIEKIALWDQMNICSVKVDNREYPSEGASYAMMPMMSGITPEFKKVMDIKLKEGRFINKTDLSYKRRVCMIGGRLYERLGRGKVIGKTLIVKAFIKDGTTEEVKFTIIGVLYRKIPLFASVPDRVFMHTAPFLFKTSNKFSNKVSAFPKEQRVISNLAMNDSLYIPWSVWMDFDFIKERFSLSGSSLPPSTLIPIKAKIPETEGIGKFVKDEEYANLMQQETHSGCTTHSGCEDTDYSFLYYLPQGIKEVCDKIRKVLKGRYGKDKAFIFSYGGTFIDEIKIQTRESNKLLGITTVLALLLSGIILTSMMLLSVHKRVSEIGVRRAFGARKKDIFLQISM